VSAPKWVFSPIESYFRVPAADGMAVLVLHFLFEILMGFVAFGSVAILFASVIASALWLLSLLIKGE
jgi:hypothetical protein